MLVVNTTSATAGVESPFSLNRAISPRKRVPSSRRRNPGSLTEELNAVAIALLEREAESPVRWPVAASRLAVQLRGRGSTESVTCLLTARAEAVQVKFRSSAQELPARVDSRKS